MIFLTLELLILLICHICTLIERCIWKLRVVAILITFKHSAMLNNGKIYFVFRESKTYSKIHNGYIPNMYQIIREHDKTVISKMSVDVWYHEK